jgi:hypothetical protein
LQAKPTTDLHAPEIRQTEIQEDEIRPSLLRGGERLLAGRGEDDLVPFLLQQEAQRAPQERVVVDQENRRRRDAPRRADASSAKLKRLLTPRSSHRRARAASLGIDGSAREREGSAMMTGTDRLQPGRDGEQTAPLAGADGSVWERVPSGVLLLALWLAALAGAVAILARGSAGLG